MLGKLQTLEKARDNSALRPDELPVLEGALAAHRRELSLLDLRAAVAARAPDARRRALEVARQPAFGSRRRLEAAVMASAPAAAARILRRRSAKSWVGAGGTHVRRDGGGERRMTTDLPRWRKRLARARRPAWLGTIRRLEPLSEHYGRERGTPVDRYYIEQFLAGERERITGRVLEVLNRDYTERFGASIERSDVLDIDARERRRDDRRRPRRGGRDPSDAFDCFVLTQTLQYVYDLESAVAHVHRILRPGGTVLCTVPTVSRIGRRVLDSDQWRLTEASCRRLFGDAFVGGDVHVRARGNVLAGVAFLMGMAAEELSSRELECDDPFFPLLITVRATKASDGSRIRAG